MQRYFRIYEASVPLLQKLEPEDQTLIKQYLKSSVPRVVSRKSTPDGEAEILKDNLKKSHLDQWDRQRVLSVMAQMCKNVKEELQLRNLKRDDPEVKTILDKIFSDTDWLKKAEDGWLKRGIDDNSSEGKSKVSKDVEEKRSFLKGSPLKVIDLADEKNAEFKDPLIDLLNVEFPESNAEILKKDDVIAALGICIYTIIDEDGKHFDISLYPSKGKGINALGLEKLSSKLNLTKNFMSMIKTNKYAQALSDNLDNWLNNGVVGRNAGNSKLHKTIAYAVDKPTVILGKIAKLIGAQVPDAQQIIKRVKLQDTTDEAGF